MIRLWLGRAAGEWLAILGVAALVFVTALVGALAPRYLEARSSAALTAGLATAPSISRNLVIHELALPAAQPLARFDDMAAAGSRLGEALPAEIRDLVMARSAMVETTFWQVRSGPAENAVLRLRVHEGALDRIRLVSGGLPGDEVGQVPDDRPAAPQGQTSNVYDAVIPAPAAIRLGLEVGDQLPLQAWLTDDLNIGTSVGAVLRLVGTYELSEPDDQFWISDGAIAGWRVLSVGINQFVETGALLSPGVYDSLAATAKSERMTLLYQYRFYVDTDRLSADRLEPALAALRRLESAVPRTGISPVASNTRLGSGLLALLQAHRTSWRSAEAIVGFVGFGVLAIAAVTLAVVVTVASAGRRRVAAFFSARGASRNQLASAAGAETVLVCLPPTLIALTVALLAIPASTSLAALAVAGLVFGLAVAIMLGLVLRVAPTGQGSDPLGMRLQRPLSPRRLVAETSLAIGALAGAWLIRERGVDSLVADGGTDPMIVAVLGMVGLAAGIVSMRLYPLPARLIAWLASLRRGLLPVLAARRLTRAGSSAAVLLLLVATTTVGTFASVTLLHLQRGAEMTAWYETGADFRIDSASLVLPAGLDPAALPGVEAAATGWVRSVQTGHGPAWLAGVDEAALDDVLRGRPIETPLAAALAGGGGAQPLPAIAGNLGLRPGDVVEVTINRVTVSLRIVRVEPAFAGVPAGRPFVAASAEQLSAASAGRTPTAGVAFLRAPPSALPALREAVAAASPDLRLVSRAERAEAMLGAPVLDALRLLIAAAALVALCYAGLALAAAIALAARAQRVEVAHLRALGLGGRGHMWLALLEYGPAALAGYLIGVALGIGLFTFIEPALGLGAVLGSSLALPVAVEPLHLLALLAAMLVILTIGWLTGVVALRDTDPATTLHTGAE